MNKEIKYLFSEIELLALAQISAAEAIVFIEMQNWEKVSPLEIQIKLRTIINQHVLEHLKRKRERDEYV